MLPTAFVINMMPVGSDLIMTASSSPAARRGAGHGAFP
jgi:hypothetical protein